MAAAASPRAAKISTSILGGLSTIVVVFFGDGEGGGSGGGGLRGVESRERARDLDKVSFFLFFSFILSSPRFLSFVVISD